MIQSRAQFGVFGAAIPLLMVVVAAVLFLAASGVLMRESIKAVLPVTDNEAIILLGVATFIIGYIGYELIHRVGAYMTVLSLILFAATAVLVCVKADVHTALQASKHGFAAGPFNLVIAQAASWALGYGPYVADYSRYLPANVKTSDTFWSTYGGCGLGCFAVMALGALLAIVVPNVVTGDPGTSIAGLFGALSKPALIVIVMGVVLFNVLCLYSAYMSTVTIFSGFRKMTHIRKTTKFIVMAVLTVASTLIAVRTQYHFNDYFADILNIQLYVIVPWSAINLVDYYLVKHGKYDIPAMYDSRGQYGKFNVTTLTIYAIGILSTIPFMDLSFYHSYFAKLIGADVSWIPSLVVPGVLYYAVHAFQRAPVLNAE